jgi:hypothetical protein
VQPKLLGWRGVVREDGPLLSGACSRLGEPAPGGRQGCQPFRWLRPWVVCAIGGVLGVYGWLVKQFEDPEALPGRDPGPACACGCILMAVGIVVIVVFVWWTFSALGNGNWLGAHAWAFLAA